MDDIGALKNMTEELNPLLENESFTFTNVILMDDPEEMLKPWVSNPMFFEIAIVHAFTFIFGLIGNGIVIIVMAGDRRVRTATNTFLVSLAAGDLLMLCVYGPLETYQLFVIEWKENSIVCKAAKLAELLSATSSVLNLLAVTIERFLVIVFPMKSRTMFTVTNMAKAVISVWLAAFVLALPILFSTGTYQFSFTNNKTTVTLNYCDYSLNYPNFAIYEFVIIFLIPSILMTACYSSVIRELWASTKQINMLTDGSSFREQSSARGRSSGNKSRNSEVGVAMTVHSETHPLPLSTGSSRSRQTMRSLRRLLSRRNNLQHKAVTTACRSASSRDEVNHARKQVIKMLILVVILFFVCWGPRLTMEILQKFQLVAYNNVIYRLKMTFNLMTFMHACINPFIYGFMSKNFRFRFFKFLQVCGCRARPTQRASEVLLAAAAPERLHSSSRVNNKQQRSRGSHTKQTDLESATPYAQSRM